MLRHEKQTCATGPFNCVCGKTKCLAKARVPGEVSYRQNYSYTSAAKGWQTTTTRPTESRKPRRGALYIYTRVTRFFDTTHNPADSEVLSSMHATCACLRIVKNKFVDARSSMERMRNFASIDVSVSKLQGDRNLRHRTRQIRKGILGSSPATGNWRLDVP